MANNPLNLALRFVLELVAWFAPGYWAWTQLNGVWRYVLTVALPLALIALWGTFRVPDDPRDPPIAIPGALRLLLEFAEFSLATALLIAAGHRNTGIAFAVVVLAHYAISYDRIRWLLTER